MSPSTRTAIVAGLAALGIGATVVVNIAGENFTVTTLSDGGVEIADGGLEPDFFLCSETNLVIPAGGDCPP